MPRHFYCLLLILLVSTTVTAISNLRYPLSYYNYQALLRNGAASISYVPIQIPATNEGLAATVPNSQTYSSWSFSNAENGEQTSGFIPPLRYLTYPIQNYEFQTNFTTKPQQQILRTEMIETASQIPNELSSLDYEIKNRDVKMPLLPTKIISIPKTIQNDQRFNDAKMTKQTHLQALQNATTTQRIGSSGFLVPVVPTSTFPTLISFNDVKMIQKEQNFQKEFLLSSMTNKSSKNSPLGTFPVNYCSKAEFPDFYLNEIHLARLDHFVYNRSCSSQFFQCSIGETFVLNCPGDDQVELHNLLEILLGL